MNQEWRTTTVLALCRRMLDSREFEALPILADALQDAGCSDDDFLARCREPDLTPIQAARLVNLAYSDETAAAVRWLEQFVRDINYRDYQDDDDEVGTPSDDNPHTYEYVIEAAREALKEGDMYFGSDAGSGFFHESDENRREFFRNWSLVTGLPAAEEEQERISFSCAC